MEMGPIFNCGPVSGMGSRGGTVHAAAGTQPPGVATVGHPGRYHAWAGDPRRDQRDQRDQRAQRDQRNQQDQIVAVSITKR